MCQAQAAQCSVRHGSSFICGFFYIDMARPIKNNADYFSHDADMRNDVKIKALRRKFSHVGYAVWCYLLEVLTDSDFFEIEYNELNTELLSADFDISTKEFKEIIDYCIKIELLQLENNMLFSTNHKKRFAALLTNRTRKRIEKPSKKGVTASHNLNKTDNGDITASHNPTVKESKVNKSKLNYIIEKENKEKESKENKEKKLPFEINNEIIEKIKDIWQLHYANTRNTKYQFNTKDISAITDLFYIFVDIYPENNLEQTIKVFEYYFENALKISDKWYFNNMTIYLLQTKFNEINTYISNENNWANNERNELYRKMQSINDYLTEQGY